MMTSKEIQSKLKFVKHTEKTIKLLNNLQKAFSELRRHNSVIMNTLISENQFDDDFYNAIKDQIKWEQKRIED